MTTAIPDLFHSALKFVSYNRYFALGAAVCVSLGVYGCVQPTVPSPFSNNEVNASTLAKEFNEKLDSYEETFKANLAAIDEKVRENETLISRAAAAKQDTDALFAQLEKARQDRLALINTISGIATPLLGPTVAPIVTQLLPFGVGALGLGVLADNRRKDRKILALQTTAASSSNTGAPNVNINV